MKVLILTGGRLNDSGNLREKVQRYNPKWVIAADSGLVHAQRFGLIPNEILGDFDSVDSALVKQYQNFQGEITQYPPRKDYTDTELAIEAAMEKAGHTGEIWILGGTGSRIDHSLANVTLLKQPTDAGVRCRLLDGHNTVQMVKAPADTTSEDAATDQAHSITEGCPKGKHLTYAVAPIQGRLKDGHSSIQGAGERNCAPTLRTLMRFHGEIRIHRFCRTASLSLRSLMFNFILHESPLFIFIRHVLLLTNEIFVFLRGCARWRYRSSERVTVLR